MRDAVEQFRDAMRGAGICPPLHIEPDGRLHRFSTRARLKDSAGWYVLHSDGIPAGAFGDWRSGLKRAWHQKQNRKFTPGEIAAHRLRMENMRQKQQAEQAKRHKEGSERATAIWDAASPASGDHPYLLQRGVKNYGLRRHGKCLLAPLRDGDVIRNLQFILPDATKIFLKDGRVSGCYFLLGEPNGVLHIAEGYATAASIHQATGVAVAVAFNAGNLLPVARKLRAQLLNTAITVCADDDEATLGNPGLTKASEAAQVIGARLAVPDFGPNRPEGATDFNDLHRHRGLEAVKAAIARATFPDGMAKNDSEPDPANGSNGANSGSEARDQTHPQHGAKAGVKLVRGDTVQPEPIRWIWEGWLAKGKLHILAGQPGTGKTSILVALAATITSGATFPDGNRAEPGSVLIWSGEDGFSDTLLPRFIACGGVRKHIYHVSGRVDENGALLPFDPALDMADLIAAALTVPDLRLIILDPVVSVVPGDSHRNAEVRRALQPLAELAEQTGAAVMGLTHLTKGTAGRDPLERVTGSVAFAAMARLVWFTAMLADPDKPRRMVRAKSNIGPSGDGFEYSLTQSVFDTATGHEAQTIEWGEALRGSAKDLIAELEGPEDSTGCSKLDAAMAWLPKILGTGLVPVTYIEATAKEKGHAWPTVRRAKKELRVKAERMSAEGWGWRMPKVINPDEDIS